MAALDRFYCTSRVGVPVFLRSTIATCDFPGDGGPNPLTPSGSAHELGAFLCTTLNR